MVHAYSANVALMMYEINTKVLYDKEEYGRQIEELKRQKRQEKCCERKCKCKKK